MAPPHLVKQYLAALAHVVLKSFRALPKSND
jgi:hypothetical protein